MSISSFVSPLLQKSSPSKSPTIFSPRKSSTSEGSFAVDPSLAPDVRFSVYYYDLNHVGNKIKLILLFISLFFLSNAGNRPPLRAASPWTRP